MKLFAFALLALGSAQEVYDPDNCTNGNGRCDAQCNTAFGSREQCNSGNRIDRACCTVQEACVLVSDDANVDCGSFPVVLEGAAFNCASQCNVVTTAAPSTAGPTTTGAQGGVTTGGSGTTGAATTGAVVTTGGNSGGGGSGAIVATVSLFLASLFAM